LFTRQHTDTTTYIENVAGLLNRLLGVEREACVDLCRDFAGHDLEDFLAELNEETVQSGIDLLVKALALGDISDCLSCF
jgi:hypothetical protein